MKYFFLLLGLLCAQIVDAQTNRYSIATPAKSTVPSINYYGVDSNSYPDLFQVYQYANSIHERNAKVVDTMIDNLYNLKSQVDDLTFKNKIDSYLNQLKSLRLGSLLNAENDIKKIDWAIRDEIEDYKLNRAKARSADFYSGSYYKIVSGGVLRDSPKVTGKQVGVEGEYPAVMINAKVDENYYQVEANQIRAFVSRAFIGEMISQSDYESIYSTRNTLTKDQLIYKAASDSFLVGNYISARENLDILLGKYNDPELLFLKALTYYNQTDLDKALLEVIKAIQINPNEARYLYFRGELYYRMNDFNKSIVDLTKVINLHPEISDTYFFRAQAKSEMEDIRGAIKDYDMVLKLHSDSIQHNYDLATVYNNKSYCFVRLKDYQAALPLVNKALKLNEEYWYIWDTRGELFFKTGKYNECIADMSKAISIEEHDNSFYYRGISKIMLKLEGGCEDLSRAGELGNAEAYVEIKKHCK